MIDDFLPLSALAGLLDHALDNRASFAPTSVKRGKTAQIASEARISEQCALGLGPHKAAFTQAVRDRLDEFVAALGIPPFAIARSETELVAHGDQAFYKPHIDTFTQSNRQADKPTDRVVSAVYYFHREPKGFTGGEIAILPFSKIGDSELVEPRQNRLVVFPSFAWHEVRKVSCPSGDFADSRFAINCWLHRDRQDQRPGGLPPAASAAAAASSECTR